MPASKRKNFAIVCDSSCDLPLCTLERAGVVLVPLVVRIGHSQYRECLELDRSEYVRQAATAKGQINTYSPSEVDFLTVYQALAEQGYGQIVSVHVSSKMRDACKMAQSAVAKVVGAKVTVLDTKAVSAEYAMILSRIVTDRDAGLSAEEAIARAEELSAASRMLIVPTHDAKPAYGIGHRSKGILGHVSSIQRRAMGVRSLMKVSPAGQAEELLASTDMARMAGNMARVISRYSQKVGRITYVEMRTGARETLHRVERPLDTNEFDSDRAAVLCGNPSTCAQLGIGAVGIAYAPASLITAEEAASVLSPEGE